MRSHRGGAAGVLAGSLALAALAWAEPRPVARAFAPARGGVQGYDAPLRGPERALALLDGAPAHPDVEALNRLVYETLEHGPPRRLRATQAWLVGVAALALPDLRTTQDARRLVQGARGLCSDAVIVLAALCERAGLRAEMIDLRGHVVARVETAAGPWIADPDLGVAFASPLEALVEPAGLERVRAAILANGHPATRAEDAVRALASVEDNAVVPAGVLSPRLARLERVLDAAGRALPLCGAAGAGLVLARRRARPQPD